MWRSIQQLIGILRRDRQGRGAEPARTARLGIETLENRTVLSANFGVDFEAAAYYEFNAPPQPRLLLYYEAPAALADDAVEQASSSFAEDRVSFQAENGEGYATAAFMHFGTRPPAGGRFHHTWSPWDDISADQLAGSVGGDHPEDKVIGSTGSSDKGPQLIQSQAPADNDAGPSDSIQNNFASNFDPPRVPGMTTLLERIAETRRVATSPFPALIVTTTDDDSSTADVESLLATYATLATSIDNDDDSSGTSHDAAFDGYAPSWGDDEGRNAYMRLLAEDQARDAADDAGGFVELDETSVAGSDGISNLKAETQREAIESALRSLAAHRDAARATTLPENWLEQMWLAAELVEPNDATADRLAAEPGGMILLQPTAGDDELIVAANFSEAVKTAVEMEATIGAFQAFDVSIDDASAAVVRPAPAGERDSQRQGDEALKDAAVEHEAASGLGVLTFGAIAIVAKQRLAERRRSRLSGDAK